eukprot:5472193-Amphidinium_carterae.1
MATNEQLQQQLAQVIEQVQRLQQENQQLHQYGFAALPGPVQTLQAQTQASQAQHRTPTLVDVKGIGKPTSFAGGAEGEQMWREWSTKLESFIIGVYGERFRAVLAWAAESAVELSQQNWEGRFGELSGDAVRADSITEKVSQVYIALQQLTSREAFDIVRNTPVANGVEAWRRLAKRFDPCTGSRQRSLLKAIINPKRATRDDLRQGLEKWEDL